jgi:glycosyltransferase involved in cell wall biosynthesis
MALLAREWAVIGREVVLVTLARTANDVYELDPLVRRLALEVEVESHSRAQAIWHNVRKILELRRAFRSVHPHVVISFVNKLNVLVLLAGVGLRVPVIVSERSHPAWDEIGRVWSLLRRLTYRRAAALVVQSEEARRWANARLPAARTFVIPNPVAAPMTVPDLGPDLIRRPIILAVGRLAPEKCFDLLIQAFGAVARYHVEWSLVIVGQGPSEHDLKCLAAEVLPAGAVVFPGLVKDLGPYYREAGLFVLSSRYEGFPNALLEAMASGCPVIATDSPGGTADIVRHGLDGVLVPPGRIESLAAEMSRLMSNAAERRRLGARAVEVSSRFGIDRILNLWNSVIAEVRR